MHIDRNGERYGPYSLEEVNACLANGTLLPTDLARLDSMTDWVPLGQTPGVVLPHEDATPIPASEDINLFTPEWSRSEINLPRDRSFSFLSATYRAGGA